MTPLSPLPTSGAVHFDGDASFSKSEQFDKLKNLTLLYGGGGVAPVPRYSSLSSSPSSRRRKRAEEEQSESSSTCSSDSDIDTEQREQAAIQPASSTTTTTTTTGALKVSFATGKAIVSSTNYTLRLDEFTKEELLAYWYSSEQFQSMRKERKRLVRAFENNKGVPPKEYANDCFRGLEAKTKAGMAKRQFNIMDSMNAVLDEQDRHDDLGCSSHHRGTAFDPVVQIASLYRRYTQSCQVAAEKVGLEDEQWVNENVRTTTE